MLSVADRQRFARHLLLAEVGEAGQERLCAAAVQLSGDTDPRVTAVARDYLERAGIAVTDGAGSAAQSSPSPALTSADVHAFAGDSALEPAAAAVLGALHAVETIKRELALGAPLQLTAGLQLASGGAAMEPAR